MRSIFEQDRVHSAIRDRIDGYERGIIDEVSAAIAAHDVVVVGMKQNPFPKKARKLLKERGIAFEYLEYGSYLGAWRRRLALKMWTGWSTFPMIFVKGTLIGGASELAALMDSGALREMLD